MWSGYFGVLAWTYLEWVNYSITQSIFIHLGVLIPLFITNAIFAEAEKNGAKWYKDFRLQQDIEAMDKRLSRSNYEKRVRWDLDREA
tara:strand:- start:161 stop:421 length:261 start_codon:yes stop_codon:yes gene_type:complete